MPDRAWGSLAAALLVLGAVCLGAQSKLEDARRVLAEGRRQQGIELLRSVVTADPGNADARLLLGSALALEGRRGESMEHLAEAVRLRPDSAQALNTLGMALSRFGEPANARTVFEKALRLDPRLPDAHVNLALVLAQSGEFAGASDHLSRAIDLLGRSPAAAYPRYLRAKVAISRRDEPERAKADLEAALDLRPDYAEAWTELAAIRRELLDETGAIEALEKAVALNPRDTRARRLLGKILLQSGAAVKALPHLRAALADAPEDRATLYHLQRALADSGQPEESERVRRRLAELIGSGADKAVRGRTAMKLNNDGAELDKAGDHRAALEKFRAALDIDPTHAGFRLNYALSLCRLARWDEGIAELREVLRLEPGNVEATKALYIALDRSKPRTGRR